MIGRIIELTEAPKGARIIVCGGRHFGDAPALFMALDLLSPSEIAQGGARGADTMALAWAADRGVSCRTYEAGWSFGSFAGHARNQHMFDDFKPDGILATPGGNGTRHMEIVGLEGGAWVVRL